MSEDKLSQNIEAILFYTGEPVTIQFLADILEVSETDIEHSVEQLRQNFSPRGILLVQNNNLVTLATAPECAEIIEKVIKEERERDLGRAGIETLTIVAYKGPISRKEIEYIRGVNSQFALRNLLLRGLVEKQNKEGDDRVILYTLSTDALLHLGLSRIEDLPEYTTIHSALEVAPEPEEVIIEE